MRSKTARDPEESLLYHRKSSWIGTYGQCARHIIFYSGIGHCCLISKSFSGLADGKAESVHENVVIDLDFSVDICLMRNKIQAIQLTLIRLMIEAHRYAS